MVQLMVTPAAAVSDRLAALRVTAADYAASSKSPATVRAYRADWADFTTWCVDHHLVALPATPDTVALYLGDLAATGRKASTIGRRLSSISEAHQLSGVPTPTKEASVRTVMAGIRRRLGTAPSQKAPVVTAELRRLLDVLDETTIGLRDRALLLLGFAGGFRRAELVSLDVADLVETEDGLRVKLRRSKTDQEGEGRDIGIPFGQHPQTCPIRAVRAWRTAAAITEGPLFRAIDQCGVVATTRLSDRSVARIIQRTARLAGLDASRYAGHSLRSGLATAAAAGGASERAIMAQTGHRSLTMVRRYIRSGSLFRENAAAYVGL